MKTILTYEYDKNEKDHDKRSKISLGICDAVGIMFSQVTLSNSEISLIYNEIE